jgi:hypothetical protein
MRSPNLEQNVIARCFCGTLDISALDNNAFIVNFLSAHPFCHFEATK